MFEKVEKGEKCMTGLSFEPAAIRLTPKRLQESARWSECFLLYIYFPQTVIYRFFFLYG